jgi:hypothetical protein
MKKVIILKVAFLIVVSSVFGQTKAGKQDATQHINYYTCPMYHDVIVNKAGQCPICGMNLGRSQKEEMKARIARTYPCPVHVDATGLKTGMCSRCSNSLNLSEKERMKAETAKIYTCLMHADVASNKSGQCSKCGMVLTTNK